MGSFDSVTSIQERMYTKLQHSLSWLRVGYFGLNGPFRRYGRLPEGGGGGGGGGEEERNDGREENVQTPRAVPTTSAIGPCPTIIKLVRRPGIVLSTIAPPDHSQGIGSAQCKPVLKVYCHLEPINFNCSVITLCINTERKQTFLLCFW